MWYLCLYLTFIFPPSPLQTLLDPLTLYNVAEIMVLGAGNELYLLDLEQLGLHPGQTVEFAEVGNTTFIINKINMK